jgi:membrane protease YdiL (CAAX protease family)
VNLSTIAIVYCVLLLLGLPLLAARTGLREEHAAELAAARSTVYLSAALSITVLAGVTFGVAAWQRISPSDLGWRVADPYPAFGWAVGVAAAGLAIVWGVVRVGQKFGLRESPLSLLIMPRSGRETRNFLLLAAVAAVGEEYLYRGYMYHVLAGSVMSAWPAAALTALSFGVAHGYQRAVGMVRATLLGGLLALPVVLTGSLFPAIVAHFWINAAVGLGGWRRLFPELDEELSFLIENQNQTRDET